MQIDVAYRVVTPLFCAGADPNRAELRLPSFKGALRFWWRALAWSRCGGELERIREEEDTLFGSAGKGQSRVIIRLDAGSNSTEFDFGENLEIGHGSRYLGYGVLEGEKRKRACLLAPFEFTVRLRGRRLNDQQIVSIKDALVALGTFGGMGSKSRNGYGSLSVRTLGTDGTWQWSAPHSIEELGGEIEKIRRDSGSPKCPEYTAVSSKSRHIMLSVSNAHPMNLLNLIGLEMLEFRKFARDDGVAFGLPRRKVRPARFDRRASPLFVHIHECGNSSVAVLSFLPARFLPEGKSDISVGGTKVRQKPEKDLYSPVHEFLNRLLDPARRGEPFTDAIEVRP